ncbi:MULTISPECIES: L-idonate 5-dehydrogenase [Thalassospira]|jgi:L-idonate 5-dehydrogenase|uniref:L-idonate 5-dehydrogenase n=2 Tax=Thalassospira xiamenensis TaxID=220697 RepID=A0ABR5Y3Y0_9PROT|nr:MULTISPECIES: L-idonate 5-dehydrogenase [Thalassospira]MBL4841594.1 L-idonate 5-dehydrogenase [Thalassospira sp.]MBR9780471.1 L-idonate 5-dehydrogenase [Rhodospirillales bacterium]AJD50581.1 L-idonate 5-dehydrogenase [Thalassospira xiamenensis M-5 = DSM 17429]KZD04758.1 L-idonate 5-dehydrogenase [Thalassospira xiamenensis]KZD05532.1 L-idonate 5-dehydrogenase [Thalassospira xiamenensis]|tara:strand:+ start:2594 stop:3637 length:1044 start_codon:yes stop_codon:yes gene_type:complete
MQTRVCRLYGQDDLRIETENAPASAHDEVLIRVGAGGVCGSDMHYYFEGGIGQIRVREPIILGHEAAGTIVALGSDVTGFAIGQKVAINPSHPCGTCCYCKKNLQQHCLNMKFFGSAMPMPHIQGAFRDLVNVRQDQCFAISNQTDIGHAACAEPLAVCLHAVARAGDLSGKKVLITGAGPIGSLCAAAAKRAGASEIVVTDLQDFALNVAQQMGATRTINIANAADDLKAYEQDKGQFDVCLECSAAPAALRSAISVLRPQGILVQVGVAGEIPVPFNPLVAKEITITGTFRFHAEFADAVRLIDSGDINVTPIITQTYPIETAQEAFEVARDRSKSVKVQLSFAN